MLNPRCASSFFFHGHWECPRLSLHLPVLKQMHERTEDSRLIMGDGPLPAWEGSDEVVVLQLRTTCFFASPVLLHTLLSNVLRGKCEGVLALSRIS